MTDICDRCEMPVIERDGRWMHAEAADEVFCALVMGAPARTPVYREVT